MALSKELKSDIAEVAVKYLENRMNVKQRLLSFDDNAIWFDDFMELYTNCDDMLAKKEIANTQGSLVRIKWKEVEELLGYVKESIAEYGFVVASAPKSETRFVRECLDTLCTELEKKGDEPEKLARVARFRAFFSINDSIGFESKLAGKIRCESGVGTLDKCVFSIQTQSHEFMTRVSEYGYDLGKPNVLENEVIAILDELYLGSLKIKGNANGPESVVGVFQVAKIDGEVKAKALSYDDEVYGLTETNEDRKVMVGMKFRDALVMNGLDFAIENVYVDRDFNRVLMIYNSIVMSEDERRHIDEAAQAAVSWWVRSTGQPNFLNGEISPIEQGLSKLALAEYAHVPTPPQEKFELFKEHLSNSIKRELYSNRGSITLRTDYGPWGELSQVVRESGIDVRFPWKTSMTVKRDEVKVNGEVIYKAQDKDMSGCSTGPQFS